MTVEPSEILAFMAQGLPDWLARSGRSASTPDPIGLAFDRALGCIACAAGGLSCSIVKVTHAGGDQTTGRMAQVRTPVP